MKFNCTSFLFFILLLSYSTLALSQEKVIDSLENVLRYHKQNDTTKVNLLNKLAYRYSSFDIVKADEKAQEALDLAKQLNFKRGEAKSYIRFGYNHIKKSEKDKAELLANKALKLCEEINNQACINASYICLAEIALRNSNLDKALTYYEKLLHIFREDGDLLNQADMLNNLGVTNYKKGDFDEAINFYKQSHAIRVELGQEKLSLGTLNNIAIICLNQGRYSEALQYFNQILSVHRKDNNKSGIALVTYNMSAVYNELKQYDKTLKYLEESLELNRELENRIQISSCLVNMGSVYADLKEFPKALDLMTESLIISKEINDKVELSAVLFQLGDLHLKMKQPEIALKHFKTSLELSSSNNDKLYICHSSIGLAQTYVLLEDYSKALDHALKGKEIADDMELLAQQKLATGALATIYSETRNYKKAFESHQLFKKINDSLFNKENIEKITQLEYDYKYKQTIDAARIRELQLTKTVAATNKNLAKSKQNYLWAIIGFLLVSIVLGGIIFYLKFTNIKSKAKNIEIEQKLLRSQMTPHFIFNSLSVLQGMILNKEEKKSVYYLSKFSKLLRIILENSRDKAVSLSQELAAIQHYLALQNLENEAYNYTVLVEDTIDVPLFEIPPMLIQPFVENAIEHAFADQKENRKIDIRLRYLDKSMICKITDNGVGVESRRHDKNEHKKSLSTVITSDRLKILSKDFKMKGSVTIEDRKKYNEQGTIVTLVIPHKILIEH
ncbi:tetratricopeptide repeat protein [Psychroserpens sp.]|uniref:tetratricopeptide repeat protein n=1 Tax=Psychroserpens sp. TaxID=2020870 RepID=UPI002B2799A9|nr:tetratricopeptide repeat protein [Psychroserpens sp.]